MFDWNKNDNTNLYTFYTFLTFANNTHFANIFLFFLKKGQKWRAGIGFVLRGFAGGEAGLAEWILDSG